MTSELLIMSNKGKNALKYDQSIRKVLLDLIKGLRFYTSP